MTAFVFSTIIAVIIAIIVAVRLIVLFDDGVGFAA